MASRNRFLCLDCWVDTGKINEYYMLGDSTWELIHDSREGMLCIGCAEKRLGRKLTPEDFFDCYLNNSKSFNRSQRLMDRLTGKKKK